MQRIALIAMVVALLTACATPTVPRDEFYRLTAASDSVSDMDQILGKTLLVKRFVAEGLVSDRPIVYASAAVPHRLHQYRYSFWSDPPTRMLQEAAVAYLRRANIADIIVTPETRANAVHSVSGKIKRLERRRGGTESVIVQLELSVHREEDGALLWIKDYTVQRDLANDSIHQAVLEMDRAVAEVYRSFVDDLGKL